MITRTDILRTVMHHVLFELWIWQSVEEKYSSRESGLDFYRARRWREAQEVFRDIQAVAPDDGPSAVYLRCSAEFCSDPPPTEWNGV